MSLYGPIVKLEEERRRRRLEELNRRFEATVKHIEAVKKVNADFYKAKKAVYENGPPAPTKKEIERAKDAMMGVALPLAASAKERGTTKPKKRPKKR